MKIIYENQVTIQDYCYTVSVNPINGEIKAGQTLKVGDNSYKITSVG